MSERNPYRIFSKHGIDGIHHKNPHRICLWQMAGDARQACLQVLPLTYHSGLLALKLHGMEMETHTEFCTAGWAFNSCTMYTDSGVPMKDGRKPTNQ